MHILFSAHALAQMQERGISEKTVRQAMNRPDRDSSRIDGTRVAQRRVRWHNKVVLCRVIYALTSREAARIITVYMTTKFAKYQ